MTPFRANLQNRLPAVLEETVRQLTEAWTEDAATRKPGMARPVPCLVLRTRPMVGPSGRFISVSLERSKLEHSLTGAAGRFRISPREVQVVALLLDAQPTLPLYNNATNYVKKPFVKGMWANPVTLHAWKFVYIEHDQAKWDEDN